MSGVRNLYNKMVGTTLTLEERDTGTVLFDGKKIFRRIINFKSLPNSTTKQLAHGITGISFVTALYGFTKSSTTYLALPHVETTAANSISLSCDRSYVTITTGSNRSSFKESFVIIEYTTND